MRNTAYILENGGKDELLRMSREDPNPNVVQFFDVLECPELYYVVMEPLHGLDLLDQIEKDFPVTESYCRDVMRQVCSALQFLHSSVGIYHRDVKLENFRYRDSFEKRGSDSSNLGDLVLVDFGFAHFIHKPWDRRVCGTLMYLAPEATRAAKFPEHADSQGGYSCAVDLWAAGVVLYIVLTGQPPFEDEDIWALGKIGGKGSEILAKALNCSNLATVSDEAVSLLRGLLELDPQTRITIDQALQHPWFGLTEEQLSANKISVPPESYQLVKQVSRQSSQISMDSFAD